MAESAIQDVEHHRFVLGKHDTLVGQLATVPVREGDTLADIARNYGLGLREIGSANPGVDMWVPEAHASVLLPLQFALPETPQQGIVINLAAMRLFYFPATKGRGTVVTFPVGIGKEGRSTPMGQMAVARKTAHPVWYVPESIRRDHERKGDPLPVTVSPGPDNPLGDYALYLSRPSYLIHGTNKPFSIGLRASNGCIRLYPEDISILFRNTSVKTPVRIVNQPYLVGWLHGVPYLEAHAPHEELNPKQLKASLFATLKGIEKKRKLRMDWKKVEQVLAEARGIPVPILEGSESPADVERKALALNAPRRLFGQPEKPQESIGSWYIKAMETRDPVDARRWAALLNHQGPQIPARAVQSRAAGYAVIAGPFRDAAMTKAAVKRMKIDLELSGEVLSPREVLTQGGWPTAMP